MKREHHLSGNAKPLGVTLSQEGANFALFAKHATKVTLLLKEQEKEQRIIHLDPKINRTGDIWHIFIKEPVLPFEYAFHVDGHHRGGNDYNPTRLLTDPYARLLTSSKEWGAKRHQNLKEKPWGLVTAQEPFNWEGVKRPHHALHDLIIYEMHVRGFTQHPSSHVHHPGTFLGVIEKIPYLIDLGVNAVELLPIQEFDECGYTGKNPKNGAELYNYWGYSTLNFFMPMNRYSTGNQESITEFKMMVKALHKAGIEVILDIVFNHTGEKDNEEEIYSFRGIDRTTYYMLDKGKDCNYTGCNHTMNLNHPVMRQFVRDCLFYWANEMLVDGFRFDLATVLNRDTHGKLLQPSALIEELTYDPYLSHIKLIAEPWDLAGYQVGGFYPHEKRWSEWNDKYRDGVRKFLKGDPQSKNEFAHRITGSHDIYPARSPCASINFITAHDGFSLYDLVSYNQKDTSENGEENKDGSTNNLSWNCGAEGSTDKREINDLRARQMKNFIVALFISRGVPMLLMGDEQAQTRHGNNNTWCQDSELNWFFWSEQNPLFGFVRQMIDFRKKCPILTRDQHYKKDELSWYGKEGKPANWDDPEPCIGMCIHDAKQELFIAFNATNHNNKFTLPLPRDSKAWYLIVNTNEAPPSDFIALEKALPLSSQDFTLERYSSIILQSK